MSTISTILSTLRSAVWAIDVRDEIANAIEQCYKDVNSPSLVTDGIEEVIGDMVDNGRISGAIVEDLGLITEGTSNLFDFTTVTAGRLNTSTGEVGEASGYWTSDFIPVENGKTYYFANTDRRVAYNSSKAYSANISGTTWTASADGYIRVSVTSANRKTAKINEGSAKDYRPGRSPIDFNLRDDVYRKAEVDAALAAVTIATDPELETAGAAADAKATGDAISALNESLADFSSEVYVKSDSIKHQGSGNSGYKLDANGYLVGGSGYIVRKYRVIPGETIYLKLSKDADTVYNFQTTSANPSASSGNIVESIKTAVDDFVAVPAGANYLYTCQLTSNDTYEVCGVVATKAGVLSEIYTLIDRKEIIYASADLSGASYISGGAYANKIFLSYIPVTDAGTIRVTWRDLETPFEGNPKTITFVVCKLVGSAYRIVGTFDALSYPNRTNVYTSDFYVDGEDAYYVGYYGMNPCMMNNLYRYGWGISNETFSSSDDLTEGTEFTRGSNWNDKSLAMYPTVISSNQKIHQEIAEIKKEISGNEINENGKYVHFSIDDSIFWTNLIDNEATYDSAFEEGHLALYKSIHDRYGMCITLNLFCTTGNYSIEDVPSKFAAEFKENAHWLKFAYHAEDSNAYLSNLTVEEAVASYNKFVTGVYTMTGTTDAIDRIARLGFFDGSLTNVLAIRDCPCGIVGLLCADDTRNSYYLGAEKSEFVRTHAMYRDAENQLVFLNTIRRFEYFTISDAAQLLTPANGNINRYIEFFTHEAAPTVDRLTQFVTWSIENGYKFGFMQDVLRV